MVQNIVDQKSFCASRQAKSQNPSLRAFLDPAAALRFAQDDKLLLLHVTIQKSRHVLPGL